LILNNYLKSNNIDMKQLLIQLKTLVFSTHNKTVKLAFLEECRRNYNLLTKKEQQSFDKALHIVLDQLIIEEEYNLLALLKSTGFLNNYKSIYEKLHN